MRLAWVLLLGGCAFKAQPVGLDNGGDRVDAMSSGFDAASCPASYTTTLTGYTGTSRYRLITDTARFDVQNTACNADLPGKTHLVVFDAMDELVAASTMVDAMQLKIWVGAVQQRTALVATDSWLDFHDAAVPATWWSTGEPNDGGSETDHSEQFTTLERGKKYLADSGGASSAAALCECDGQPIAPAATAAIAENLAPRRSPPSP